MMLLSLAALLLAVSSSHAANDPANANYFSTYTPSGLQSGPDAVGGTFVSAAVYSAVDNSVIMTGSTWGRYFESREQTLDIDYDQYQQKIVNPLIVQGCFVATAALPGSIPGEAYRYEGGPPKDIFWSHRQRIRAPSANGACNAVHFFEETSSVIIAGHSEERRNKTLNAQVFEEVTQQFGLMLDMDWNVKGDKSFKTSGGQIFSEKSLVYPVAMTSRSTHEEDGLFAVFMEADNDATHLNVEEGDQPHDPSKYFNYGAGFGFSVARFDFVAKQITPKTITKSVEKSWQQPFNTTELKGKVYVNDIESVAPGLLVMVGTTNGQGPAFGAETDQGKDLDGFLAKISPTTGQLIIEPGFPSSYRIQSKNNKHGNDWVAAVCRYDGDTQKHVYIAGTTEGKMPLSSDTVKGTSAFLMKFDVRTMQPIWTKQLGSEQALFQKKTIARGMACTVTPDGSSVWFGGVVEDGGVMQGAGLTKSFGGRDIFLAKIDANSGVVSMIKQMGTDKDDEFALRGGLVTDTLGNAVLIGNTYGSFYRIRSATETSSDVFVLTVSLFDGQAAPRPDKSSALAVGHPGGTALLCLSLLAVLAAGIFFVRRRFQGPVATDRSKVTTYLGGFDIEDVELKHSATGGWHCNFVNKLSAGKFTARRPDSRPPLTAHNSGELPDSLMRTALTDPTKDLMYCDADDTMDSSSRSTNGLLEGGESGSLYGDLVEAYNSSRESRSRKRGKADKAPSNNLAPSWGKDII